MEKLKRKWLALCLLLMTVVSSFGPLTSLVYATPSTLAQTDWSTGDFSSSSGVTTSTAGQITLAATSNWYNSSWGYRKKITIDHTKVSANQTNFPVLINTTDATLKNTSNSGHVGKNDGTDILFTGSNGTSKLDHELEKYTGTTGEVIAWIRIPSLSSTVDTDIYIYYGNSGAADQQNKTGVWDSNFRAVYHLKETPTGVAGEVADSTSNANNGSVVGSTNPDQVAGQVDGSFTFHGTESVNATNSNSLNFTGAITLETWINPPNLPSAWRGLIFKRDPSGGTVDYGLVVESGGNDVCFNITGGDVNHCAVNQDIVANQWQHIVATFDQATDALVIYKNNQVILSTTETGSIQSNALPLMLAQAATGERFNGKMDEVRVSSTARSASWIATEYANETSPSTFYAVQAEETTYSASTGTLTSSVLDATDAANWGILSYTASVPGSTSLSLKARTSNSPVMAGATAFSSCTAITSGTDISSNSCVTDSHRYIQYEVTLSTSDQTRSPTFQDISIIYAYVSASSNTPAPGSPWTQTDWSGGSGQTSWSATNKYSAATTMDTTVANQVSLQGTASWLNSSWAYRKKITFNNAAQAENLVNFPVLVSLSSSNIDYTKTQDAGQDIRFADSDGTTALSYEIEKWDESGTSLVWVKVPQIDASSSTDSIYVYYGNTSASDGQSPSGVWDSNYKGVWHLKELGAGVLNEYIDSTANGNNGQGGGGTVSKVPTRSIGMIGYDQLFVAANDSHITAGTSSSLAVQDNTMQIWLRAPFLANNYTLASKSNDITSGGIEWGMQSDAPRFAYNDGVIRGWYVGSYRIATNTWYLMTVVWRRSAGFVDFYFNGVYSDSLATTTGTVVYNGDTFRIADQTQNDQWTGDLDELRISNTARSAAWISADYKSQTNTFISSFGSQENYRVSSGSLTSSIFDSQLTTAKLWGALSYSLSVPANTTATVKVRTSDSSTMSGAPAFSTCTAVSDGMDISSNNCVSDAQRYVQYELSFTTSDSVASPIFSAFTLDYVLADAAAPTITLTPLSPDPNTQASVTLAGTATDAVGTVSAVQYQIDSTSGSWTNCSASDGSYSSATESFSCTTSSLSNGSHTMYVRATDNANNTTASNFASDSFTVDTVAPVEISIDSPSDNAFISSVRPAIRWKASSDATSGIAKYVVDFDNSQTDPTQTSDDFSIDNIPASRTFDLETNKYTIHYENFSDSDLTNNYISVTTKSSPEWGANDNDGKLREGKAYITVKALDAAGNFATASRTVFVDRTSPTSEFTQINALPFSTNSFTTSDTTPTIYGKVTDPLVAKVSSGPRAAILIIKEKHGLTYALLSTTTIEMRESWYTCDNTKVIDTIEQRCARYLPFSFTPQTALATGDYTITLVGKDNADNSSAPTVLYLKVRNSSDIVIAAPIETIAPPTPLPTATPIPKKTSKSTPTPRPTPQPTSVPAPEEKTVPGAPQSPGIVERLQSSVSNLLSFLIGGVAHGLDSMGSQIASIGDGIGNFFTTFANQTPTFIRGVMLAFGRGTSAVTSSIAHSMASVAYRLSASIEQIAYRLDGSPTRISDVEVIVLSPTSVQVAWKTNHPATGKVNYGLDETYPQDIQSDEKVTDHKFVLTDLKPNTEYSFEVMSQDRNYVYDANRKFKTPKAK